MLARAPRCMALYRLLLLALSVGCGALLIVQVGLNHQLQPVLGSGLRAATVSEAGGAFFMLPPCLLASLRHAPLPPPQPVRCWMLLGGVIGAACASINVIVAPRIGMAMFFVTVISAQLVTSLLLDHFGVLGRKHPLNAAKLLGVLFIAAGLYFVQNHAVHHASTRLSQTILDTFAGLMCGVLLPFQAVLNRALSGALRGSAVRASLVSLASGGGVLLLLYAASLAWQPWRQYGAPPAAWYAWLAGTCSAAYVLAGAAFSARIGVNAFFVAVVSGQLGASLLCDAYGALGFKVMPVGACQALGVALVLVGAAASHLLPSPHLAAAAAPYQPHQVRPLLADADSRCGSSLRSAKHAAAAACAANGDHNDQQRLLAA